MKKIIKSSGYAVKGVTIAMKQTNFKIQISIGILVVFAGFFFQITATEWCMILICSSLVLSLEMFNTALEHFVDFVSPGFHKTAGNIKDIAAGAVLVSSIISLIVGFIIFTKYIIAFITH